MAEPSDSTPKQPAPPVPLIGLALGGGMARGFAHIGVLKTLSRHGIRPGLVAGTSIGALVGGAYLAGKLDALEDWALSLNRRKIFRYLDFRVRSAGIIGGHRLNAVLDDHFGKMMIEDLPVPLVCIASDLVTGHEVWLRRGSLVDSMRASFALPGVFPPVDLNNRLLVDGALLNPVPVSPLHSYGAHMTIAVDLNADMIGKSRRPGTSYQSVLGFDVFNPEHVDPDDQKPFAAGLGRRIFNREPNAPSLFGVMVSALTIIQDRLTRSRLAGDPPDVHIRPRIGHIGMLEFERAREMIHEGELAAERALDEIHAAVNILIPPKQS